MRSLRLLSPLLCLPIACAVSAEPQPATRSGLTPDDCDSASNPNKQRVCHASGPGHVLIEVSNNAASKHLDPATGHAGDTLPGDAGLNCVCEPLTDDNICDGAVAGTGCSDEDACTADDACSGDGSCLPGTAVTCDTVQGRAEGALTQCQEFTGSCASDSGCEIVDVADGSACDDGDGATCGDVCSAGVCEGDAQACDPCATIVFADPNIDASVRSITGVPAGQPITSADAVGFTFLSVPNAAITDLSGVECLVDLEYVDLRDNDVTDIAPLSAASSLQTLWLDNLTGLTDISALDGLPLATLRIPFTSVTDFSPLASNTTLSSLTANNTGVADISGLANAPLFDVWLFDNNITDISALGSNPALTHLRIYDNPILDISPLATSSLQTLWLDNLTGLTDISALDGLPLATLRIPFTSVTDFSPLASNTTLSSLTANNTGVADISGLANAPLFDVWLFDNNITDISPLFTGTTLGHLRVENNAISDTTPLAGACHLSSLRIGGNAYGCPDSTLASLAGCVTTLVTDCP